jgi:hypothetical protein
MVFFICGLKTDTLFYGMVRQFINGETIYFGGSHPRPAFSGTGYSRRRNKNWRTEKIVIKLWNLISQKLTLLPGAFGRVTEREKKF